MYFVPQTEAFIKNILTGLWRVKVVDKCECTIEGLGRKGTGQY
jgi:hypothetical protein